MPCFLWKNVFHDLHNFQHAKSNVPNKIVYFSNIFEKIIHFRVIHSYHEISSLFFSKNTLCI